MRSAMTTQRMRFRKVCLVNFTRDESGSLTPFTMMMFFLMLLIGGLAVDVMRHERTRVRLQQTLDNSVLAAAARSQALDPESVVRDYFDKAGLSEYLTSVTVEQGLNFRSVFADAEADTRPFFMSLMGIDEFFVNADSAAEEKISNVEVSLVLDVSGSMAGTKINTLKPAASNFVDTILQNSEEGKASISLVPFSTQVNVGATIMSQYNVTRLHDMNSCIEFAATDYSTTELTQAQALVHNGHFDRSNGSYSKDALSVAPKAFNCLNVNDPNENTIKNTSAKYEVLPLSGDGATLKTRINALQTDNWTSAEIGVKWGVTFLDPETRGVTTGLVSGGLVSSTFESRPLDFDPQETIKVVVLMSDGENTNEYRLKSAFRSGLSNVWWKSATNVAVYHNRASTSYDYYYPYSDEWKTSKPSGSINLTWPDVFKKYTVKAVAYNFLYMPSQYLSTKYSSSSSAFNAIIENVGGTQKNTRLDAVCDAAKAKGIVIFSISFQAGAGADDLAGCATDANHFFEGDPATIGSIFQTIANQISYLRLTL
jgi:Flp pilus assembly protein TadG